MPCVSPLDPMEEILNAVLPEHRQSRGGRSKPHKVAMVLAALDFARSTPGWSGEIPTSSDVENRFKLYLGLVAHPSDRSLMANPFIHLRSSGFWILVPKDGVSIEEMESIKTGYMSVLRKSISHVVIGESVRAIFSDPTQNIRAALMLVTEARGPK